MNPEDINLARSILLAFDPRWSERYNQVIAVHTLALVRNNQWRCIRLRVVKWPPPPL